MKELSNEEKEFVENLKSEYRILHSRISEIEQIMKNLSEEATELVKDLQSKREGEKKFTEKISKKYGEGFLDAMTLTWQKNKIVDERSN